MPNSRWRRPPRPSAWLPGRQLRELGVLAHRILIVEKGDHGGVLLHRDQQVDESAGDIRPYGFIFERAGDARTPHPCRPTRQSDWSKSEPGVLQKAAW